MFISELVKILLNGLSGVEFVAYYLLGIVGMILGWGTELFSSWKAIQQEGGFKFVCWIKRNSLRVVLSFVVLFIGIVSMEDIMNAKPGFYNSILTGYSVDSIIKAFKRKRKTITDDSEAS